MRGCVFCAFLAIVLQLSKRGKIMERLENRHNSDTQTAIFEETSDTLSIADMLKRTLERTVASGEDMTRSLGQTARNQKLPPATLIKFLIAAEGGSLAKELHRAGIDATPAAVSQRRRQIPPAVFRKVFLDFTSSSAYGQPNRSWGKRWSSPSRTAPWPQRQKPPALGRHSGA